MAGLSLGLSVSGPLSPASKAGGGGEGGGDAGPVGIGVQQGGGVGIGQDVARLGLSVSISRPLAVVPVVGIGVAIAITVTICGIAIISPKINIFDREIKKYHKLKNLSKKTSVPTACLTNHFPVVVFCPY